MNNNTPKIECHITIENDGISAIDKLQQASGLSKQKIKQAMQKGAVWFTRGKKTQRLRRVKKHLKQNDILHCYYDEQVLSAVAPEPELIADEGDYSIWNKPYGLRSQGSKWGDHCTINRWVEINLKPQRPCFIVHRLDRAASGLIILAHTKAKAAYFSQLFRQRKIDKRYRAIVHGDFSVSENGKTIRRDIEGKKAVSHVKMLAYDAKNDQSLLEIKIDTGRKHQIRRHLSESGFPIVGDRLYGIADDLQDLRLQSVFLAFSLNHENDKKIYQLHDRLAI
ncbi:MAG: RNA pseudouridine synthase [Gammaproteobacteria bacterium]|nr:RNA pseudouridine synthase [Gammaproteobacteria bacterium]